MPTVVDKFDQAEHAQRSGFERALHVLVKEQYWRADLSYGSGAKLSVFFTDRQAVEDAIVQAYPRSIVFQVMES